MIPAVGLRHLPLTVERLVKLYDAQDKPELAEKWRVELESLKSSEVKPGVPAVKSGMPLPSTDKRDP